MNHFMSKKTIQKIMAIFVILILSNFIMSTRVWAAPPAGNAKTIAQAATDGDLALSLDNEMMRSIIDWIRNNNMTTVNPNEGAEFTDQQILDFIIAHKDQILINIGANNSFQLDFSDVSDEDLDDPNSAVNSPEASGDGERITDDGDEDSVDGGLLLSPVSALLVGICDGINSIMQEFIIGQSGVKLNDGSETGVAVKGEKAIAYMTEYAPAPTDSSSKLPIVKIKRSGIQPLIGTYRVGVFPLTPAEIFSGNVAALNANFFSSDEDYSGMLGGQDKSIVVKLKEVVSAWYIAIRNIAIVGLLSVLLYLGIRIVISSSAGDKAKYKQTFMDWLIALCLIFFLHYIMAFTMTIADQVTSMLSGEENSDGMIYQLRIILTDDNNNAIEDRSFYSNFTGVARIKTQFDNVRGKVGYTVMYIAFTAYTVYFVIVYMKRLLMLSFYTLMAPAVALSYPLDKLKDGKAQAFNFWLKDYIFYAFLPALHMIIYTVFISSALSLAVNNMIYALVAMAFIVPAEKIVKKMFGIHGNTEERSGGFAGGAVAGSLMSSLRKLPKGGSKGPGPNRTKTQSRTRIADNPNSVSFMDTMNATNGQLSSGSGNNSVAMSNTNNTSTNNSDNNNNTNTSFAGVTNGQEARNQALASYGIQDPEDFRTQDPDYARELENAAIEKTRANNRAEYDKKQRESLPKVKGTEEGYWKHQNGAKKMLHNAASATKRRLTIAGGAKGIAKTLGKKAGRAAIKGVGMAAGATALGMAGLGIGMVGGDLGDAFKGLSVGAAAGGYLGGNLGNAVNDTLDGKNALGRFGEEVKYGSVEESDNARSRRNYISDEGNRARILADHPEFNAKQVDEYAQRRYDMMYDSGVDDEKMADKALKLEDALIEQGLDEEQAHRSAYGALNAAQKYSFSDLADQSKREKYQAQVAQRAMQEGGVSKENAERMARNYFDNMAVIRGVTSAPKVKDTSKRTQDRAMEQQKVLEEEQAKRQQEYLNNLESSRAEEQRKVTEQQRRIASEKARQEGKRVINTSNAKTSNGNTQNPIRKINTEKAKRGPGRPRKN